MKKGLQRLLENEESDTYYEPPIPAASHCYLDSLMVVWVRSYCERKVFTSLTLGTKFWSIAGLQSTCYGRAVELELKLSLLIEQRTVLAGNGNLTPIPTKAEASPRHLMKTARRKAIEI